VAAVVPGEEGGDQRVLDAAADHGPERLVQVEARGACPFRSPQLCWMSVGATSAERRAARRAGAGGTARRFAGL
jgi:hypothetical protein